jgi:DNA ligase 1
MPLSSVMHTSRNCLHNLHNPCSIRFPRLVRQRDDKAPENATTANQIMDMYNSQDCIKNNVASTTVADDDDWEL